MSYPLGHPCETAPLGAGEEALWCVYNRTFHRPSNHGLVLTTRAIYVYRPLLYYIRRWRRFALEAIEGLAFVDSSRRPALHVRTAQGTTVFRMPAYDGHDDDMEFNREELRRTIENVRRAQSDLRAAKAPMR